MKKALLAIILLIFLPSCFGKLIKKRKTISAMDYNELKKRKIQLTKNKDTEGTIKYLQKMIPLCQDLKELRDIMLELADLLFDTGKLQEAEKLYREFSKLYPSDVNTEYTLYKAILCCFYKTLDTSRDQTKTQETLELVDQFLERERVFTHYTAEVKKIGSTCNQKLAEAQLSVIDFYIKRGNYQSAHHRIANVKKEFLSAVPEIEVQLLHFEYKLAHAQHNAEQLKKIQTELTEKFPEHPFTLAASDTIKKTSLFKRF
ncbi:outer membrane protein assembly factor BamD [Candidatus Dependentiae bacterium]|nr:outer membrane protein assembly factor BamD [Candidatus Dependentiae bacterium]